MMANIGGPVQGMTGFTPSARLNGAGSSQQWPGAVHDDRNGGGLLCNRCNATISGQLWHCNEFDGGDFDICSNCRQQGVGCYSASHCLVSMDTALWQNVVYVTYDGMVRPDGKTARDGDCICDVCDKKAPDAYNCTILHKGRL